MTSNGGNIFYFIFSSKGVVCFKRPLVTTENFKFHFTHFPLFHETVRIGYMLHLECAVSKNGKEKYFFYN